MRLSRSVEVPAHVAPAERGLRRSRTVVQRLAALFSLDAFAGGFIVGSFIVFWFGRQFGADAELMGLVFFGVGLLQAASSVLAGWLGERIGLLEHDGLQPPPVESAAHPHSAGADTGMGDRTAAGPIHPLPDGRSSPPGVRGGARRSGGANRRGGLHECGETRRAAVRAGACHLCRWGWRPGSRSSWPAG